MTGQSVLNKIMSSALAQKAETSKEFKHNEMNLRTALFGSEIL